MELSNQSTSEKEPSETAVDSGDCGEVIHNDFGDFLGNTTYLPGLPITRDGRKF